MLLQHKIESCCTDSLLTLLYAETAMATALSLNASVYHTIVPEADVQVPGTYLFSLGFSTPLDGASVTAFIISNGHVPFQIRNALDIETTQALQAHRYTFDVTVFISGTVPTSLVSSAVVDVISESELQLDFSVL